jgi:sugar phosphate isomerase/epimerase
MNVTEDLSIQLYSLRNFGDLPRQLEALAEIGFRRVELIGSHLEDAKATRALLDAHGMSAPTAHVSIFDLRDRLGWVADQANTVGVEELFMPALPDEERDMPAAGWQATGAELGEMAEMLGTYGIDLGYHNHDWELKRYPDGTTPLEHLFLGARDSPLTFEADLAWIARGGADPIAWMKRLQTRLTAVHVKDIAAEGANLDEDGWSDIGAGTLDWQRLWRQATALGAKWMVLEHDKPKDPIGFARASRAYLLSQFA